MNSDTCLIFGKRRGNKRNAKRVGDLAHRLRKWLCIVHDDAHRPNDVRRPNRLVRRKRRQQQDVICVIQKDITHQVVRDNCTNGSIGIPSGNKRAVQRFHNV